MASRRPRPHEYKPAIFQHDELTRPQLTWVLAGSGGSILHAPALNEYETDMLTRRGTIMDGDALCGTQLDAIDLPGPVSERTARRCVLCCKILGYPGGAGSPWIDAQIRQMIGLDPKPTDEMLKAITELCKEWVKKAWDPASDDYAIGRADMAGAILDLIDPSAEAEVLKAS